MEHHCVVSELELEQQQQQQQHGARDDCSSEFAIFKLRLRRTTCECREDSDGDLDVPRRKQKRQRQEMKHEDNPSGKSRESADDDDGDDDGADGPSYTIEVRRGAMSWDTAGSQLWRAAFLLAEYIHANSKVFIGRTMMELGCGIGLASIAASQFAQVVFATDADAAALQLAQRNADRNKFGDLRTRLFDWNTGFSGVKDDDSSSTHEYFRWTQQDRVLANNSSVVIASDVFYDDETTTAFLQALYDLMLRNPRLTALIALEKRVVFSAYTMSAISLGFDAFQEHLCTHEPVKTSTILNQVVCAQCLTKRGEEESDDHSAMKFVARSLPIDEVPHVFEYERVSTLMLWQVDAIVVPAC